MPTTTTNTTAAAAQDARTKVLAIVDTFTCMSQYDEMKRFFTNTANSQAMLDAIEIYGLPPQNTPSYHTPFKWHDFCDWDKGMYKFFLAASFFNKYPNISVSAANCKKVLALRTQLDSELIETNKVLLDDFAINDITDYKSNVQTILNDRKKYYSDMNCATVIANQVAKDAADALAKKQAADLAASAAAATSAANSKKTLMYGGIGLGVLVVGIIIYKVVKK
jgi:hypothetical protein